PFSARLSVSGHRSGTSRDLYRPLRSEFKSQFSFIREAAVMAPQSPRSISVRPARHRRPAKTVHLRCEPFEDRIVPALFNVSPPLSVTGLNNNGCVVTSDLNKDGLTDAILTNEGTDLISSGDRTITVLYGRAGGGFNRLALDTGGTNVAFAAVADINGD